jgi:hypothetical protein
MKRRIVGFIVVVSCALGTIAYIHPAQHGAGQCHWEDSHHNNVGSVVTFIPPDSPSSGGYTCTGVCIGAPDGPMYNCVPGPILQQGNGVYSQDCRCSGN